jgi:hypothetical protein
MPKMTIIIHPPLTGIWPDGEPQAIRDFADEDCPDSGNPAQCEYESRCGACYPPLHGRHEND